MILRALSRLSLAGLVATAILACSGESKKSSSDDTQEAQDLWSGDIIEQTEHLGPVSATLKVAPKNPTMGDPITVQLEVTAEPGVTVEMPDFGQALGRFSITRFVPRESARDGKWVATQTYTLQAPMSGRQRIPPLRVEFVDQRDSQTSGQNSGQADPDQPTDPKAPAATKAERVSELLTQEVPLQIASILAEDLQSAELSAPLGRLRVPTFTDSIFTSFWFWLVVGVVLALVLFLVLRRYLAARNEKRRIDAYGDAIKRLTRLESRGLPEPDQADGWYVELSGIIRRYLEDRYNLRAPELTTEEFLKIARGSGVLTSDHRKLLEDFLTRCDRVKFARYAPDDEESKNALTAARSFLEDTRPQAVAEQREQELAA